MPRLEFEPYYCYRRLTDSAGYFTRDCTAYPSHWVILKDGNFRNHIDKFGWYHKTMKDCDTWIFGIDRSYKSWRFYKGKPAPPPLKIVYDDGASEICNGNRLVMALRMMTEWDTPEDFIQKYQEAKIRQLTVAERSNDSISRHLGIFLKPEFGRYPENPKKKTFDYIHVGVTLCAVEDKKKFVQENYREIAKRVIANLEKRKGFQKYGVPINCLKVSDCMITRDDQLIFTLELKEV